MQDDELIPLLAGNHELECPHCKEKTVHNSPGDAILFATVKCTRCGRKFLVSMGKPTA